MKGFCCKSVISEYNDEDVKNINLHMTTIKNAFSNSSYIVDDKLLDYLFSGTIDIQ